MKRSITTLALFVVLTLAFSSLTGCGGTQPTTGNNTANAPGNTNTKTGDTANKSSAFPPLASGLAEADLEMLDGTKFKISSKKGKVLLLNIWGTWCGPCRAEMPTLMALQNEYGPKGFEVIGMNIGDGGGTPETVPQITKFVEQMKLNYTIARSPNAVTNEFYKITKQSVVPQTMLVDREGHLRGVFVGGGERVFNSLRETVAKTMAE
ncbi:MAG: TlpA family protein disulfide reductase [Pyrinomonadaceae bacterium]